MKRWNKSTSIAAQTFTAIISSFIVVIVLHAIFFQHAFTNLYTHRLESDKQKEFETACNAFQGSGETFHDRSLAEYAAENETAVLVFDSEYNILDTEFFSNLTMLTAETEDKQYIKIPIQFLRELPESLQKNKIRIVARRLGNSKFYIPYTIRVNDDTYYQKNTVAQNSTKNFLPEMAIKQTWYTMVNGSTASDRAWMIYEDVKECLMEHENIDNYLSKLPAIKPKLENQEPIRYFTYKRQSGGKSTYFVTIDTVGVTGSEAAYMKNYLSALYIGMFFMLTVAAFLLAKRLSKPTKELSVVANRIAKCDFSARAQVKSNDELGQLSRDINIMADNLSDAMDKIILSANEAKENEQRIRTLLANLAHEFKTPLSLISLYSEVIEAGVYEKDPSYYFENINEQIDSMTRMVDDTIQLSKLQTGMWSFQPSNHMLGELIHSAIDPFREQLEREEYQVNLEVPDMEVYADGVRIKQVLTNLISNAIKYSDDKKTINIRAREEEKNVTIQVINYGHVSQEDLERIWTRYYRASEQTTTRLPSEGIGLDIVREILVMHGSRYGVKNQDDTIMFHFTLKKGQSFFSWD